MTKILVLYYSSYGHTSSMAEAVAEGIREGGAEAVIRALPCAVCGALVTRSRGKARHPQT